MEKGKSAMKMLLTILGGLIVVGLPQAVHSQSALSADANAAVQIAEARKANAALMRQYTWNSRTEIIDQGQVKDTRIELVNCAPDGQLQRSLLNDQSAPMPRGFLRRDIAEKKKKELEQYLTGLRGLLEQYTLPTTGKILDFMMSARTMGPDANGSLQMTGQNVVMPGDSLTMWIDARTRHPRRIQVNTTFQGDPVELTATFNTLPSGLNYVAYSEAMVLAKQLSVQMQNFDYTRPN
ncbi:MAG: hypothetical protein ABR903_01560 [Thermodesulfovibrionales bacterium]|jgi:hypothetical protein